MGGVPETVNFVSGNRVSGHQMHERQGDNYSFILSSHVFFRGQLDSAIQKMYTFVHFGCTSEELHIILNINNFNIIQRHVESPHSGESKKYDISEKIIL